MADGVDFSSYLGAYPNVGYRYGTGCYGSPEVRDYLSTQSFRAQRQQQQYADNAVAIQRAQYNKSSDTATALTVVGGLALIGGGIFLACTNRGKQAQAAIKEGINKLLGKTPQKALQNVAKNTIKDGVNPKYAEKGKNLLQRFSGVINDKNAVRFNELTARGGKFMQGDKPFTGIATLTKNGRQIFRQYEEGVLKNAYHLGKSNKAVMVQHFDKTGKKVIAENVLYPKSIRSAVLDKNGNVVVSKIKSVAKPNVKPTVKPSVTGTNTTGTPVINNAKGQYKLDGKTLSHKDLLKLANQEGVSIPKNIKPEEVDKYIASELKWFGVESVVKKPIVRKTPQMINGNPFAKLNLAKLRAAAIKDGVYIPDYLKGEKLRTYLADQLYQSPIG